MMFLRQTKLWIWDTTFRNPWFLEDQAVDALSQPSAEDPSQPINFDEFCEMMKGRLGDVFAQSHVFPCLNRKFGWKCNWHLAYTGCPIRTPEQRLTRPGTTRFFPSQSQCEDAADNLAGLRTLRRRRQGKDLLSQPQADRTGEMWDFTPCWFEKQRISSLVTYFGYVLTYFTRINSFGIFPWVPLGVGREFDRWGAARDDRGGLK